MAPVDLAGIAEPHRSAVTGIIDLARQGSSRMRRRSS
jgi:hypothetical protein